MRYASSVMAMVFGFIALGAAGNAAAGNEYSMTTGYGYNYPHNVPADYVYRTVRVFTPKEGPSTWWPELQNFFIRKKLPVPADLATELKLKVRELAQQLIDHAQEPIADQYRVIVSTFVNLNQLYTTSGLGRAMAEQMISEFQRAGIGVVDVRMTPAIQIVEGYGEYGMSRDMAQLSYVQEAQAVVVGTYTISDGQVMVNARLLQQGNGFVLSSGSIVFEANKLVQGFMQDEAMPPRRGTVVELHNFADIAPKE
jgi:TolB-like protein